MITSLQLFHRIRHPLVDEAPQCETWRIIAGIKGLRVLRVFISDDGCHDRCPFNLQRQLMILEPLKAIKGVDSFEVRGAGDPGDVEAALSLSCSVSSSGRR